MFLLLFPLAPALAADLPTTDTPVGRLALPVVPDSLVVSPDSARLVFASKAGDPTLEEKGVFINPQTTDPRNDSARAVLIPFRLFIDDKPTILFDTLTTPMFSPDSRRLGFAGMHDKTWQLVLDNKTLLQDAEGVPAVPLVFSADSAHVAWVVQKGTQLLVTVDDRPWPPIEAYSMGTLAFAPDSQHVAAVVHARGAWTIYVDGAPLPPPAGPAVRPAASMSAGSRSGSGPSTAAGPRLERFGQFIWRPDSSGLAFYGGFVGTSSWQLFSQSRDGVITWASKPYDTIMKNSPVFWPDAGQLAVAVSTRGKWAVVTNGAASPAATAPVTATSPPGFDQVLPDSLCYYQPEGAPNTPFTLLYLAQQNKKWRLYVNHRPTDDVFDAIVQGTFVVAPNKHHYAFAGVRAGQAVVIKDGAVLTTHDEAGGSTFAYSPDSKHLAYTARNGPSWFACVDGLPGAPFIAIAGSPVAFSPDSSRVAFAAATAAKNWRLIVGKDGDLQSKPYDGFLKGSHVTWRPDGTVVTIAIQKTVATRIVARP